MHTANYFLIRKKGSALDWDGERLINLNGRITFQLGYSVGEILHALKVPVDESNDTPHNMGRKVVTGRVAGAAMLDSDVRELKKRPLASELEVASMPRGGKAARRFSSLHQE